MSNHRKRSYESIYQLSESDKEKWRIRFLPINWNEKQPSVILQNFLKNKENKHNKVLEDMIEEKTDVNLQIEKRIKKAADGFKTILNEIQKEVESILKDQFETNQEIMFENYNFSNELVQVQELFMKRRGIIKQLKEFFEKIEINRINAFKIILKNAYQAQIKIAHKLPADIESFYEKELININEITLSNIRTYHELIAEFELNCEHEYKESYMILLEKQQKMRSILKEKITHDFKLKHLPKLPPTSQWLIKKEDATEVYKTFQKEDTQLTTLWQNFNPLYLRTKDLQEFSQQINCTVSGLYKCSLNLLKMYKTAHAKVYTGYFEGVNELKGDLLQAGLIDYQETEELDKEFLTVMEKMSTQYNMELEDMQKLWHSVIENLQNKLRQTFDFLYKIAILWDEHFERQDKIKSLILEELRITIIKNDRIAHKEEMKLNTHLDAIRQGIEEDIDESMVKTYTILNFLHEMYQEHYNVELAVLNKMRDFNDKASDLIIAELKRFLHFNPKNENINPTKLRFVQCKIEAIDPEEDVRSKLMTRQILICKLHTECVHNWMFGLWELLDISMPATINEMKSHCNEWIQQNVSRIEKRLEVKLAIHKPRYTTIKEECYELRKTQLKMLNERIEQHISGIEDIQSKCVETLKQLEKNYEEIQHSPVKIVQNLKNNMSTGSETFKQRLIEYSEEHKEKMKQISTLNDTCSETLKINLFILKHSQLKFLKQIKFFFQPGLCQAKQGMKLMMTLKNLDKQINKKFNLFNKQLRDIRIKNEFLIEKKEKENNNFLLNSKQELDFYDTIINKIKRLQSELRRHVFDLRLNQNKTSAYLKYIVDSSEKTDAPFELDRVVDEAISVIKNTRDMIEITENLLHEQSGLIREKNPSSTENYLHLLFKTEPVCDSPSFIAKAYSELYQSLKEIQDIAKVFYIPNRIITNKDKIQPNYQLFMEEVFGKYHLYQMQVDTCWLKEANKFLQQILLFKEFFINIKKQFLNVYFNEVIADLTAIEESVTNYQSQNEKRVYAEFKNIHRQLRPNLGHPLNADLHNEAMQCINVFTLKCCQHIHQDLEPYKKNSEKIYKEFSQKKEKLQWILNMIEEKVMDPTLFKVIEEQCDIKVSANDNNDNSQHKDYGIFTSKINLLDDKQLNMQNIGKPCFNDPIHLEETIEDLYEKVTNKINNMEIVCVEFSEKWKNIWLSDLKYLKSLYSVKYQEVKE